MIEQIKGKKIMVVGMARSGLAAVELLSREGAAKITVTDQKQPEQLENELLKLKRYSNIETICGSNPEEHVTSGLSMIVKSPGVPPGLEMFKRAEKFEIPVISEVELAYAFIRAPIIGITGTNGKTTVTALVKEILKEARIEPVVAAGNIGNPLSGVVGKISAQGAVVAEVSSFQLENIQKFRPAVAVFLNFAEDHLDYHGSIEKYFQAKVRIFENQGQADFAVLNAAEPRVAELSAQLRARILWFNAAPVETGFGVENGLVSLYKDGYKVIDVCLVSEIALPGAHNLANTLAASTAAWAMGADPESIAMVLKSFKAIEHRLEYVATINGVDYVNDSKGTNPGAAMKALLSFPGRKKILIAGGKEKGSDFSELAALLKKEVRLMLLIGETSDKLADAAEQASFSNYCKLGSLEDAVAEARKEAQPGEVVLLSPACASWDMFADYEARGRLFKKLILGLTRLTGGNGGDS
ncbi:MAG: UDP-N-acetylmuramoyl-L-alanine--D-glutamate ligase [Bacillota bacterium]